MYRGRKKRRKVKTASIAVMLAVMFFLLGLMALGHQEETQYQCPGGLQSTEPEKGIVEEIVDRFFGPIARSLGLSTSPPPGEEPVGLDVEVGFSTVSGEQIVYSRNILSGVYVGRIGMAGVYVKPGLGRYRALKLYDEDTGVEGEIWVRPVRKIRVFNGTPKEWMFKTRVKVIGEQGLIKEEVLEKTGKGTPPKAIKMNKVSVKGKTLHKILRGTLSNLKQSSLKSNTSLPIVEGKRICFYSDYEGVMVFEGPEGVEEPVYKELEDQIIELRVEKAYLQANLSKTLQLNNLQLPANASFKESTIIFPLVITKI